MFYDAVPLIIYHLMFHPGWGAACKSCSFRADNFERIVIHLHGRDANFAVVSRAPINKIEGFKKRMGWTGNNSNYGTRRFNIEDVPGRVAKYPSEMSQ